MFGYEALMPRNINNVFAIGNTRLLLSDTPETLDSETFPDSKGILWHDYVCTNEAKVNHRVFAWHLNKTGKDLKLGVTLENLSNTKVNITEIKTAKHSVDKNGDFLITVGQYLAKVYLEGCFSNMSDDECSSKQTVVLNQNTLNNNQLLGLIMDFTTVSAKPHEKLEYLIRVVADEVNSDLRTLVSLPVHKEKVHYRGSWLRGDIKCQTPTYHIGEKKAYSISNGITDNIQRSTNSYDSLHATDNPGHYGVVYQIIVPVLNHHVVSKTLSIGINPRGGTYAGAVKIASKVSNIPFLNTSNRNYAKIMEFCAPPGQSYAELWIMHAGAATLPVAIDIRTV